METDLNKYHLNSDFDMIQTIANVPFTTASLATGTYTSAQTIASEFTVPEGTVFAQMQFPGVEDGVRSCVQAIRIPAGQAATDSRGGTVYLEIMMARKSNTQIVIRMIVTNQASDGTPFTVNTPIYITGTAVVWRAPWSQQ